MTGRERPGLGRPLLCAGALLLCVALLLGAVRLGVDAAMPGYRNAVGDINHTEKITGLYLLEQGAAQGDNLIIYGSSELRTYEVSTHPANFFAGQRSGFQVNLVGRGSCQSLIHALSIAASGDSLRGQKVVLITSPQSYVEGGIAPDLFAANFSAQQYLELLHADDLSEEVKVYLSGRVAALLAEYEAGEDSEAADPALRLLAAHHAGPTALSSLGSGVLAPYFALSRYLYALDDRWSAWEVLLETPETTAVPLDAAIDWEAEAQAALAAAAELTGNNDSGMLDDYYTTYIGSRLSRQAGSEAGLSYSQSPEYDDLRVLFAICRQKGIEPLFVHVPLHGPWSDYTGFAAPRREEYYQNVREIAEEYGVALLDLTGYEYEPYFLCDVMHLGWRGWLEVDRALIDYYYGL